MRFLSQRSSEQAVRPAGGDTAPEGNTLEEVRNQGERLLAASDEAIRRALSRTDSRTFLTGARQQGGE
jgi:hypothetical protein